MRNNKHAAHQLTMAQDIIAHTASPVINQLQSPLFCGKRSQEILKIIYLTAASEKDAKEKSNKITPSDDFLAAVQAITKMKTEQANEG